MLTSDNFTPLLFNGNITHAILKMEKHFRVLFKSEMMYEMSRRGGDRCCRDKGMTHTFQGVCVGGADLRQGRCLGRRRRFPEVSSEVGLPRAQVLIRKRASRRPLREHPRARRCALVFLGRPKPGMTEQEMKQATHRKLQENLKRKAYPCGREGKRSYLSVPCHEF